ncbi:NAD(P)H-dependent FMN reductase [Hephaestia caeni]|uniref:NAD(P)H-dependent FMN reductase n=1 Tax=Hephaestia caeni TaxID=645617 RepID=A0A397P9G3_9SPHN|nr:NADPH-dependent FMN reductase [Hephaestia caeni]RIA45548.1 NAD(P)H-dependent FMN reductase [Hephaestia caeni]
MIRLLGISGSLRAGSFNTALLRNAAELLPQGVSLDIRTLHGIPLYDADAEAAHGPPEAVVDLKDAIASADGVIFATPEYNNGIPGVFKNAIDWASRPPGDIARVFGGRHIAILGASPGGFGTVLAQNHWLPVLRTLGATLWTGGRMLVPRASGVFDTTGAISDPAVRDQLQVFLAGYAAFLRQKDD